MAKTVATVYAAIALALFSAEVKADVDCSALDPRVAISTVQEAKVQASVNTLYRIVKAGAGVEGKLKQEIQNLQNGVPVSEQGQLRLRTLFLFCGMVANAKDIPTPRKVDLFQLMLSQSRTTSPKSTRKPKQVKQLKQKRSEAKDGEPKPLPPSSISQIIGANSPGSVQIGNVEGSLTIHQAPQQRHLSESQKDAFRAELKTFKGNYIRVTKLGDREAGTFADEVIRALTSSGIEVIVTYIGSLIPPRYGVSISTRPSLFAASTLGAFRSAGIEFRSDVPIGEDGSGEDVDIFVGLRP